MNTKRSIYKEHLISISTSQLECGGFQAQVAVVCIQGNKTRSQRFLSAQEICSTEAEAHDRGIVFGQDWVDTSALVEERGFYPTRFLRH